MRPLDFEDFFCGLFEWLRRVGCFFDGGHLHRLEFDLGTDYGEEGRRRVCLRGARREWRRSRLRCRV